MMHTVSHSIHPQETSPRSQGEQQWFPLSHVLLENVLTQREAPLDAVALHCLPPLEEEEALLLRFWHQGRPTLTNIVTTPLGRVGNMFLPIAISHADDDEQRQKLIQQACQAVAIARSCGARSVSLSTPLASVTHEGQLIQEYQVLRADDRPRLTTADATTSTAAVLTLEWILARVARDLRREQIVAVGSDPLASTFLRLLLVTLPHPASVILCSQPGQQAQIERLVRELRASGFEGEILLIDTLQEGESAPDAVYEATLLLGTGSFLERLNIDRIRAGTIVFRFSGPSPLVAEPLLARVRAHEDILVPLVDELTFPTAVQAHRGVEKGSMLDLLLQAEERWGGRTPYQIKSSLLAGLAVATLDVPSALGWVDTKTAQNHYLALRRAGARGIAPHLGVQDAPSACLMEFRARFRNRV
ncbi:hypothetical protein KSD_71320 [Ktedonobacter sp. SOSP1-85]|uniref:thioester reductase n=1 Tax=Ktedonobacter sp. SOSP1-85 TaxID=2778367 RepID=UPI00191654CB|nr:thioester reductase [Ktedonobacter sp. SOSP1-85]GHO79361.1 hypothetical protein KSD_71320 [Ktedonobacter sp. SOSP1-85]